MKRIKVWDLPVRLFHFGLAAAVLVAFLTGDEDESASLHTQAGLLVLGLVVFRIVYGLLGPSQARFKTFVKRPAEVWRYAKATFQGRPPAHLSHNPLGGVMVVLLLGTLVVTAGSGLAIKLGPDWDGALAGVISSGLAHDLKELHEVAAGLLMVLIPLHVAGTIFSSVLERQNLVASMVTGWKESPDESTLARPSLARRVGATLVAVTTAVAVIAAVQAVLPAVEAEAEAAETPRTLLEGYLAEAKAEDGSFTHFDAARGKELYFREVTNKDGKTSACSSCHGPDPAAGGRSPAGKKIEALDPNVNPARFTERAFAEKWFDRNCKQVLGRRCSPMEKGDFLTFVSAPSR